MGDERRDADAVLIHESVLNIQCVNSTTRGLSHIKTITNDVAVKWCGITGVVIFTLKVLFTFNRFPFSPLT